MERLPTDLYLKIFSWLNHQNLAAAHMVCRKWRDLASDDNLWSNLFEERWGVERATFYTPAGSESWKDVYIVQDRCDRVGLGLKIIREGDDYFLVHQGQIQRSLGSRRQVDLLNCKNGSKDAESIDEEQPSSYLGQNSFLHRGHGSCFNACETKPFAIDHSPTYSWIYSLYLFS